MWVQSLGYEDLVEEDMATHSSILDWIIPWTEEPSILWSIASQRVRHDQSNLALAIALGQEMCSHKSHNKVTVVVVNVVAFSFFILGVTVIKMCTLGENSTHLYEGYSQKLYESVMFKYHKNTRYFYFLYKLLVCNY